MASSFANVLAGTIDRAVRWVIVPVTSLIPVLVRTGILLALYGAMWLAFGIGLALNRDAVSQAWLALTSWPLPLQAVAWLLFLPLTAGLWVWGTDWPEAVRIVVIAGLAGWNMLVFLPHREAPAEASVSS